MKIYQNIPVSPNFYCVRSVLQQPEQLMEQGGVQVKTCQGLRRGNIVRGGFYGFALTFPISTFWTTSNVAFVTVGPGGWWSMAGLILLRLNILAQENMLCLLLYWLWRTGIENICSRGTDTPATTS
jgi:hypothetical protein